jgi:pyruvate/2-oxoglutarate/acetoin dehydrogenase E1 component
MRKAHLGVVTVVLGVLIFQGFILSTARETKSPPSLAANITDAQIVNADRQPENWLTYGRTYSEQRFSPLHAINDKNAGRLGLAWYFDLDTNRGQEATPIVVDGVMYFSTAWSKVFAVNAATGAGLWFYDPEVSPQWGANACCDVVNRGVAVWQGKVYIGALDGRLIALDAATGQPIWSRLTIDPRWRYTITGAPRIVKGKVIIGNGGAELGVRGYVTAYDAQTGQLVWRFYTVPGDPSKPFEQPILAKAAKTWTGEWWKIGGGGTVWDAIVYDPELDLLYIGVGNGGPWNEKYRSPWMSEFMLVAMDQVLNEAPRLRYMSGGQVKVPLVLKAGYGFAAGWAGQHSNCIYHTMMGIPGLKVALPSTPADAKGLMTTAIRDDNPVVYLHHYMLTLDTGEVPEGEYIVPFGVADMKRAGDDVTIVATGWMVKKSLAAAEQLEHEGISAEVIDPRTLAPLDTETIIKSVKKTGRLVLVDQAPRHSSAAAVIAAEIAEKGFEHLRAPITSVTALDASVPYSQPLESYLLPNEEKIAHAVRSLVAERAMRA